MTSIRISLVIAFVYDLHVHQWMLKQLFWMEIEEELYILQPEEYVEKGFEDKVCKFNKSLYGLK